jgi:hypothetical protein
MWVGARPNLGVFSRCRPAPSGSVGHHPPPCFPNPALLQADMLQAELPFDVGGRAAQLGSTHRCCNSLTTAPSCCSELMVRRLRLADPSHDLPARAIILRGGTSRLEQFQPSFLEL